MERRNYLESWQSICEKKTYFWSHWGDLNSRPSPYQGDAIPLSHSGSERATRSSDLTTAGWAMPLQVSLGCKQILRQTQVKVLVRRGISRGRIAWYCA